VGPAGHTRGEGEAREGGGAVKAASPGRWLDGQASIQAALDCLQLWRQAKHRLNASPISPQGASGMPRRAVQTPGPLSPPDTHRSLQPSGWRSRPPGSRNEVLHGQPRLALHPPSHVLQRRPVVLRRQRRRAEQRQLAVWHLQGGTGGAGGVSSCCSLFAARQAALQACRASQGWRCDARFQDLGRQAEQAEAPQAARAAQAASSEQQRAACAGGRQPQAALRYIPYIHCLLKPCRPRPLSQDRAHSGGHARTLKSRARRFA
jgi:hypothetical protein